MKFTLNVLIIIAIQGIYLNIIYFLRLKNLNC